MRKAEIARKFDEIVEFSGCARYIDTPVKRYSSGMYVRLAFAVAAHLEPEILIVDEVLAVGDAEFQKKCLGKMKDVSGQGRTVLFVSHNMTAVQSLCQKGLLMSHGGMEYLGSSSECVRRYLVNSGAKSHFASWDSPTDAPACELVWIKSMRAVSLRNDDQGDAIFDLQTPIDIEIEYEVVNRGHFHITLHFMTENNEVAFTSGCILLKPNESHVELGKYKISCRIPANLLNEAEYSIKLLIIVNGNQWGCEKSDVIHIDVKDLAPREIGGYHGREPGPLRPKLEWIQRKLE
jgi:lipopolysaccharide transport system ATP-binding protein